MHISDVEKYRAEKDHKMRHPEPSKAEKESLRGSDWSAFKDMMGDKTDEKTGLPYQKGKPEHKGVADSVGARREYEADPNL